jgi:6-phospho-beta-glucosidase
MKLTLIGGGGVRAPLFVASALRHSGPIGLDELCLMDIDAEKLRLIGGLCREVGRRVGSPARITTTTDPRSALDGARYAVTSIRVGGEPGRVLDERIALRYGVLGQETTGPGGFAMALRSIPAILDYAEMLEQASPGAWMFNFTNPAGLVTQALRDRGFERTVGICDSANAAQHHIAGWLGVDANRLRPEVFGLNHLSWTRSVQLDGQDRLGPLLHDPDFLSSSLMNIFEPALLDQIGMWLNEYLFYYYYAERALESIQSEGKTRGEEVLELNRRLLDQLRALDPEQALAAYYAYERRRGATYMHYARPDSPTPEEADLQVQVEPRRKAGGEAEEGYAGVALSIIEAFETGEPKYTALNVPNQGAIQGMRPGDVVEVSCVVESGGIQPMPIGVVPEHQELLMRAVKRYENLAVQAILERSRHKAVMALMDHPLVLSFSRAEVLVDEYLTAHLPYAGEWTA